MVTVRPEGVGVTRATIYRRFADKTELLVTVIEASRSYVSRTIEWRDVEHMLAEWAEALSQPRECRLTRRIFSSVDDYPEIVQVYRDRYARHREQAVRTTWSKPATAVSSRRSSAR
jgi:AcrR family transcriptional regulator